MISKSILQRLHSLTISWFVLLTAVQSEDCTQYTNSRTVGGIATIQYVSTETSISMLFRTSEMAWVAVGRSKDGKMIGSDAVIGIPSSSSVQKYVLNDTPSLDTNQGLNSTEITQNSTGTYMKFTQALNDGRFNLSPTGSAKFIWAIGSSNDLLSHTSRGSISLQLSPCVATNNSTSDNNNGTGTLPPLDLGEEKATLSYKRYERFIIVHGILAVLAWGLLAPAAILASAFRKVLPPFMKNRTDADGNPSKVETWFLLHRYLNTLVYFLTVIFFLVIVSAMEKKGYQHFQFDSSMGVARGHKVFGLIFVLLVTLQVMAGVFRPPKTSPVKKNDTSPDHENLVENQAPSQSKTTIRTVWEMGHRIFGVLLMVGSIYQVLSGLFLYEWKRFDSAWYNSILWVYVFSLVCPLLLLIVFRERN